MSFKIGDEVVLNETGKEYFSSVKDTPLYSKISRDMVFRGASAKIIEKTGNFWTLRMEGDKKNTMFASCDTISLVGEYKAGDNVRFSVRGLEYFKDIVAVNPRGWHPVILEMGKGREAKVVSIKKYAGDTSAVTLEIDRNTWTTDKPWLFFNAKYNEVGPNSDLDNLSNEEIQKKIDSLTDSETKISKEKNRVSEVLKARKETAKLQKDTRETYLKPLLAKANACGSIFVYRGVDYYICTKHIGSDKGATLTYLFGNSNQGRISHLSGNAFSYYDTNEKVFENSETGEWMYCGLFMAESMEIEPQNTFNVDVKMNLSIRLVK